jgi:hypothetical protein
MDATIRLSRGFGGIMDRSDFLDEPPPDARLTDYDRAHLVTYMRLLDAEADNADWEEAVQIIFGIDPTHDRDRAARVHAAHLARAHWMTENGYRELLKTALH